MWKVVDGYCKIEWACDDCLADGTSYDQCVRINHQSKLGHKRVEFWNAQSQQHEIVILCNRHANLRISQEPRAIRKTAYRHLKDALIDISFQSGIGSKESDRKRRETTMARYGVDNVIHTQSVRERASVGWRNISDPNTRAKALSPESIKKGNATRKQTMINRYGVSNITHLPDWKEKFRLACLAKYGVDHNFKAVKGVRRRQSSVGTIETTNFGAVSYQGSYERKAVAIWDQYCVGLITKIERGPRLSLYRPDFLLTLSDSSSLVVEIKSCYTLCDAATLEEGAKNNPESLAASLNKIQNVHKLCSERGLGYFVWCLDDENSFNDGLRVFGRPDLIGQLSHERKYLRRDHYGLRRQASNNEICPSGC